MEGPWLVNSALVKKGGPFQAYNLGVDYEVAPIPKVFPPFSSMIVTIFSVVLDLENNNNDDDDDDDDDHNNNNNNNNL